MANACYVNYRNLCASPSTGVHAHPDWLVDDIGLYVVDGADYTPNLASHQDLADISGAAIVAEGLLVPSLSNGVIDIDPVTLTAVTGDQAELIIIAMDSGTPSTSPLMLKFDDFPAGMPLTPNGGDVDIVPDAAGFFEVLAAA